MTARDWGTSSCTPAGMRAALTQAADAESRPGIEPHLVGHSRMTACSPQHLLLHNLLQPQGHDPFGVRQAPGHKLEPQPRLRMAMATKAVSDCSLLAACLQMAMHVV